MFRLSVLIQIKGGTRGGCPVPRMHGTPILRYRFYYMSTLEIAIHVEALVVAAFD
jgi:hypothetical protein